MHLIAAETHGWLSMRGGSWVISRLVDSLSIYLSFGIFPITAQDQMEDEKPDVLLQPVVPLSLGADSAIIGLKHIFTQQTSDVYVYRCMLGSSAFTAARYSPNLRSHSTLQQMTYFGISS